MRISKAWTVASKDFLIFTRKRSILYSIIGFELFVSIALPLLVRFIVAKAAPTEVLIALMNSFSFWFVIGSALLPVGIGSYSLIGEKVQKSLEPLLATPTTDEEILIGKSIAAFIPALVSNYIGAVVYMFLVDQFTAGRLAHLYYPNWDIAIILLLLAPLACLLSVGYSVLVSSRSNDVRAAQQLGALVVLPFGAVYVLSEISVLPLSSANLLYMAAVLLVVDVILFYMVRATFQRDEILTKWK
jgi:ABC-2 type transport system permease protein